MGSVLFHFRFSYHNKDDEHNHRTYLSTIISFRHAGIRNQSLMNFWRIFFYYQVNQAL